MRDQEDIIALREMQVWMDEHDERSIDIQRDEGEWIFVMWSEYGHNGVFHGDTFAAAWEACKL